MKTISILGSTGSIGTQSLDVCRMHGYSVKCLTANSNIDIMENQIREFKPEIVCMMNEKSAKDLKTKISDTDTKVVAGLDGLIECATYN
ncbi:MAG: 1-deoxy-D-xylulose-5-phosphate reductoisomerase, partial [Eubacterium sp.]|nr:1-deoxy-D-xylulose-5-phosphate reductoisomerase [Eubacterium sp.]